MEIRLQQNNKTIYLCNSPQTGRGFGWSYGWQWQRILITV